MSRQKIDTSKSPDPNSVRSKKRKTRNFINIILSTRKGRRNSSRIGRKCNISGTMYVPGTKAETRAGVSQKSWLVTTGGGNDFH